MSLLQGITVLDLSTGIAGPQATMLLADRGANVIRIESPVPDSAPTLSSYRVLNRGKRSAILDLDNVEDLNTLLALAAHADVLVESFAPGESARLGIDYPSLSKLNPELIVCSITGYGRDNRHANRPAYDQLVAARTGLQWENRGWYGSPIDHILGRDQKVPTFDVSSDISIGSDRDGPIFSATPAVSIVTAYNATLAISAALLARQKTGRGQWVETSMMQATIMMNCAAWQKPERTTPFYQFEVQDRRQTWGIVQAKDGYMCMWVSMPQWFAAAGAGESLRIPHDFVVTPQLRMMTLEQRLDALRTAAPIFKKFTVDEWVALAAEYGNESCQPVRSPEQALCDPALIAEGSVVAVDDPELGVLHQVGAVYRLHNRPLATPSAAPKRGAHTEQIKAEAAKLTLPVPGVKEAKQRLKGPLEGIRVIDFGAAVAGPWGSQLMADLGAEVIKVDPARQSYWMRNYMALAVNRSKRWIGLDIKSDAGKNIAYELVKGADVVLHNMRPQAAAKLGLDYESIQLINPEIIYCTTRGFEDGPRSQLPGNDQTGNALGGSEWEDGGCAQGGKPWFGSSSNGDLGNGFLAAIAMVQALYDRQQTGKGQLVDASILNASLFNNARVYTTPDAASFERPQLDANQTGYSALYRIYRCADNNWLCIAVCNESHWQGLTTCIADLTSDSRFSSADDREANDQALQTYLEAVFVTRAADQWFELLDRAGVPCEISEENFARDVLFADSTLFDRQWVVRREGNPELGTIEMFGLGMTFSDTPSQPGGAPPVLWQHTREVLRELGYNDELINELAATGAVVLPEHEEVELA